MHGPKWQAADWAVEKFLADLTPRDRFALGLFHNTTKWFAKEPRAAEPKAVAFLKANVDSGGPSWAWPWSKRWAWIVARASRPGMP